MTKLINRFDFTEFLGTKIEEYGALVNLFAEKSEIEAKAEELKESITKTVGLKTLEKCGMVNRSYKTIDGYVLRLEGEATIQFYDKEVRRYYVEKGGGDPWSAYDDKVHYEVIKEGKWSDVYTPKALLEQLETLEGFFAFPEATALDIIGKHMNLFWAYALKESNNPIEKVIYHHQKNLPYICSNSREVLFVLYSIVQGNFDETNDILLEKYLSPDTELREVYNKAKEQKGTKEQVKKRIKEQNKIKLR